MLVPFTKAILERSFSPLAQVIPIFLLTAGYSFASDISEPLTLASENGVLDVLMVAKAAPVTTLSLSSTSTASAVHPTGWVYEICKRPLNGVDSCPQSGSAPNYYGGTLLKLQKGDLLKVHLVNRLPPALEAKHADDPGEQFLTLNPTNIHTHGLLVAPRSPSDDNPTYGDYVFVLTFNKDNGVPVASPHMHSDVRMDFTDYEIKIPKDHPSGLFWFHPHAHGLALNQVSAGLSGLITVGDVSDYLCKGHACAAALQNITMRHMLLKDMQILGDGTLHDQEDPDFCEPSRAAAEPKRLGACAGQASTDGGPDYSGGLWAFTINGQRYPTVPMNSKNGEVWALTNSSGSVSYNLSLRNPAQNRDMIMQILSIDGVSVDPNTGISPRSLHEIAGNRFTPEACPAGTGSIKAGAIDVALCTRKILMMPSSRVEVWVTYRDGNDNVAPAPHGSYAILRTEGYQTGPTGDSWPAVDLGRVEFQNSAAPDSPNVLSVAGDARNLITPTALFSDLSDDNNRVASDSSCTSLPPGHMRRVFYGVPTTDLDAFGLAYEEIDQDGNVVGTPATDVTPFNPMKPTICVPLGPGNSPTTERWQLVNVAQEDHNFHIHQVKFRLLSKDEMSNSVVPSQSAKGMMFDNLPLTRATGTCGNNPPNDSSNPIADWRAGLCNASVQTVEIPFAIAGDFVYHCHIMEHEDGGMMARIRVRRTP